MADLSNENMGDEAGAVGETGEQDNAAIETEARGMGWKPKDEFHGDPKRWTDAATYVENGRKMLPLVQAENRRLHTQVGSQSQQLQQLQAKISELTEGQTELREFYEEQIRSQVKIERSRLTAELKQARSDGDVDREMEIREELDDLKTTPEPKKKPVPAAGDKNSLENQQLHPTFLEWASNNRWFGVDQKRTFAAEQIARQGRFESDSGEIARLEGKDFYDEVDRRLNKQTRTPPTPSKVLGSGGGRSNGTSVARTYSDLPAEAKAECDKQAAKFVKPNGQWKTAADYRKYYVQTFENIGGFDR